MCQGCRDFAEFDAAVDAYIAKALPEMLARPIDADVLRGPLSDRAAGDIK